MWSCMLFIPVVVSGFSARSSCCRPWRNSGALGWSGPAIHGRAFGVAADADRASAKRAPSPSPSPKPAGDVVLGLLLGRLREDGFGRSVFDQVAQVHEGGEVGDARGLLHVVGDDRDRVVLLQFLDQLLDTAGRNRIERGSRL